jgi:hypothetical protein
VLDDVFSQEADCPAWDCWDGFVAQLGMQNAPPGARVSLLPERMDVFATGWLSVPYTLTVANTGELGTDTVDLTVSSAWAYALHQAQTGAALADSDGDGLADTGPLAPGAQIEVVVRVFATAGQPGDGNWATVTARSSLDPTRTAAASLVTEVPAPFVQAFVDTANDAMSAALIQSSQTQVSKLTADEYFCNDWAIATLPGGYLYMWSKGLTGAAFNLEFMLLDRGLAITRNITALTDNGGATYITQDNDPVAAAAPNGRIGVVWERGQFDPAFTTGNENIMLAILDAGGNVVAGPIDITQNAAWGGPGAVGVPRYGQLQLAATDNDRFVVAWERGVQETAGYSQSVDYAVYDTEGGVVKAPAALVPTAAGERRAAPALAALAGNQMLIAYSDLGLRYGVLDSSGSLLGATVPITGTGFNNELVDSTRLATGDAFVAWRSADHNALEYAIIGSSDHAVRAGPAPLGTHPQMPFSSLGYLSVTTDERGNGIVTWSVPNKPYLFYALVSPAGAILTPPMAFYPPASGAPTGEVRSLGAGKSNTSVASTPRLMASDSSGRPGSRFELSATGLPQNAAAAVTINGHGLSAAGSTDAGGRLRLALLTADADEGYYVVTLTAQGASATAEIELSAAAPLREPNTSGLTQLSIPAGIAYPHRLLLPVSWR